MYKKYLNLLFIPLIISISACQNNQMNKLEDKQKEAVMKIFKIFDGGNVDELDDIIAPDAVEHQLDTSITKKEGREAVKETFRYFHRVFPDMKTSIHSMAVSNDTVFMYSTSVGTTAEPFMGIPANQMYSSSGVDIIRFEGEKAVEHWGFIDFNDMMNMMMQSQMPDPLIMKN